MVVPVLRPDTLVVGSTALGGPGGAATFLLRGLSDDLSTVVIDLTALNRGQQYGFGLKLAFDIGRVPVENDLAEQPGVIGADLIQSSLKTTEARGPLVLKYPDVPTGLDYIRALGAYLQSPHIWEWQPDGQDEILYIRSLPSDLPALFDGTDQSLVYTLQRRTWVAGDFVLRRQAVLERAERTAAYSGTLSNLSRVLRVTNNGSVPARPRITVAPVSSSTKLVQFRYGVRARGNLDEYGASFAVLSLHSLATLFNGTSIYALDTDSADGTSLQVNIGADIGQLLPRWRVTLVPVDETALIGIFRVLGIIKGSINQIAQVQLRWGLANDAGAVSRPNEIIPLDFNDELAQTYGATDLGTVTYSEQGAALVLEGWSSSDTVASTLYWDQLLLVPADFQLPTIQEPGIRAQVTATDVYPNSEQLIPSNFNRPSIVGADNGPANPLGQSEVLGQAAVVGTGGNPNRTDEALGTAPNSGFALPLGRHIVWASVNLQTNTKDGAKLGELRVRKVSPGTPSDIAVASFVATKKHQYSYVKAIVQFDVTDAAATYQFQLAFTADRLPTTGTVGRKMDCGSIYHAFLRSIGNPASMVLDGIADAPFAYAAIAGGISHLLVPDAAPLIPPGDSDLIFDFGTVPNVGMDTHDPRGPTVNERYTQSYVVTVDLAEGEVAN